MKKLLIFLLILSSLPLMGQTKSRWGRIFKNAADMRLTNLDVDLYAHDGDSLYQLVESDSIDGYYYYDSVAVGMYDVYIGGTKKYTGIWIGANILSKLAANLQSNGQLIGSSGIKDRSITAAKVGNNVLTSNELGPNSVGSSEITDGSVTTGEILDGTLKEADYSDGSVTSAKVYDGTLALADLSTALVNYIDAAGGGSITNNPDDVSLYNSSGSQISIKPDYFLKADTTALIADSGGVFFLQSVGAGNDVGGGWFIRMPSTDYTINHATVFSHPISGYVWVRDDFIKNPSILDAQWGGAVGDNVNDDTAELQTVFDAADNLDVGQIVFSQPGMFKISDTLIVNRREGLTISGFGAVGTGKDSLSCTTIKQTSTTAPAIYVPGKDSDLSRWVKVENLQILGPGRPAATQPGVIVGTTGGGITYGGSWFMMDRTVVSGFTGGVLVNSIDQGVISNSIISFNEDYGVKLDGTYANSFRLESNKIGNNDTSFVSNVGSGARGIELVQNEWGSADCFVYANGSGSIALRGGNIERCFGSEYIYIANSQILVIDNTSFRQVISGGGLQVPIVRATGSAKVFVTSLSTDIDTTNIILESSNCRAYSMNPEITVYDVVLSELFKIGSMRRIVSASAGSNNTDNRGQITLWISSDSDNDRLQVQTKDGLLDILGPQFFSSTTGASHVYYDSPDVLDGRRTFTSVSNAADTTHVSVNIGAFTTLITAIPGVRANSTANDAVQATVKWLSADTVNGKVWFVVNHPGIGGASGWYLTYYIKVVR